MANVLAVIEQKDGTVKKSGREVIAVAKQIAGSLGGSVDALTLDASGAAALAASVTAHVKQGGYAAVVLAASSTGKDLGPRLAVRLDAPLLMDVTAIGVDGGRITASRPVYAGKAIQQIVADAPLTIVAIRPNTFTADTGEVKTSAASAATGSSTVKEVKAGGQGVLDVGEASIVVSGGRGMKGPEHFHLIEDLAKAFGNAAVGASRAVVDAGWRPHGEQVGQTGKTVSPQLYIAVGISGAIQHLAGMRTAKVIVAINKDRDAPIFKVADYGIVGDAFEIVPRLTEEVRKLRAEH
ncbi:MAG TPA: electron transfer flavoprotein subunit alpha/FixB family protein [Gemmatimonadales bacterium]|jgi:electron transfer flavoprotein alpha subunit